MGRKVVENNLHLLASRAVRDDLREQRDESFACVPRDDLPLDRLGLGVYGTGKRDVPARLYTKPRCSTYLGDSVITRTLELSACMAVVSSTQNMTA